MKELACKDMTLVFSVTTTNEDGDPVSIEFGYVVEHDIITEPDPYITTDDDKGFYFGDVTINVTKITYMGYEFAGSLDLILKPSAQYVLRVEDDCKALLNGDSSEPVDVRLNTSSPPPVPPSMDISIIAKVETPGQNSVWGS